jgi:hypothetical protein
MKKLGWTAGLLSMAALLMAAVPARAQDTLTSHIPFDFVVGHVNMPAGNYVITRTDPTGVVQIKNTTGQQSAYVLTVGTRADESKPELVFERVADRYFLLRLDDGTSVAQQILPLPPSSAREGERVALALTR